VPAVVFSFLLIVFFSNLTGFFTADVLVGGGIYEDGSVSKSGESSYSRSNSGNIYLGRDNEADTNYRSFFDFDISSINDSATITSVQLNLSAVQSAAVGAVGIFSLPQKSTSYNGNQSNLSALYSACNGVGSTFLVATNSFNSMALNTHVTVNLGANGVSALQSALVGNFFSLGLNSSVENSASDVFNLFDHSSGTLKPVLIVNYSLSVNSAPVVSLGSPSGLQFVSSMPVNLSFNVSDDMNISNCTLFANFSGSWASNASLVSINTNFSVLNFSVSAPEGVYIWNVQCFDNASSSAFASANKSVVFGWQSPRWSANVSIPVNPSYNSTAFYQFNVSWADLNLSTVIVEHNFSGVLQNYSSWNSSNIFSYNYTGLGAGSYRWRMFGNDTAGFVNSTDIFVYVVNKFLPVINLSFNSTQGNKTINELEAVNITASSSFGVNLSLFRNSSLFSAGGSNVTNFSANYYNFTLVSAEDANYSSNNLSYFLSVNRTSPVFAVIPNQSCEQDNVITINLSSYASHPLGESLVFNSTSPSSVAVSFSGSVVSLSPQSGWYGTVYIVFNASDLTNDTAVSNNVTISVSQKNNGGGGGGGGGGTVTAPVTPPPEKTPVKPKTEPPPAVDKPKKEEPKDESVLLGGKKHRVEIPCNATPEECEAMLNALLARMDALKVKVEKNFSYNESSNATLVAVILTAEDDLENFNYYQDIPKCMAIYAQLIKFKTVNYEIIKDDPMIVWHFGSVKKGAVLDASYEVKGKIPDACQKLIGDLFYADEEKFSPANVAGMVGGLVLLMLIALVVTLSARSSGKIASVRAARIARKADKIEKKLSRIR